MRPYLRLVILAGVLALAACEPPKPAAPVPGANPNPPVPPPQAETMPKPPVSEQQLVWRPGEWEWVGSGYVWQSGDWEPIAGHSNEFLPGHWTQDSGTWGWVRGHWL